MRLADTKPKTLNHLLGSGRGHSHRNVTMRHLQKRLTHVLMSIAIGQCEVDIHSILYMNSGSALHATLQAFVL